MEYKKLEYPLSPKYIPTWTINEALRELIANALDTNTKVHCVWKNGYGHIVDTAEGIPPSFWVLGEGNHGVIGQFGEGLKLAMLVLAREKRNVVLETVGYQVIPNLIYSASYDTELLELEYSPNIQEKGTSIHIACTEEEFNRAKDCFLVFNPIPVLHAKLGILDAPGKIYVNGVFVQTIRSLWGYNITDKSLANRDRSILDWKKIERYIARILALLNNLPLVIKLLEMGKENDNYFYETCIGIIPEHPFVWRKAFYQLFGSKACLPASNDTDNHVKLFGWHVIKLPFPLCATLRVTGVLTISQVLVKISNHKIITIPKTALSKQERNIFVKAKAIAKELVPYTKVLSTNIVDEFNGLERINGLYKNQKVYIRRSSLQNLAEATGILIHERLHGKGLDDLSVPFECAMTSLLGTLAVQVDSSITYEDEDKTGRMVGSEST